MSNNKEFGQKFIEEPKTIEDYQSNVHFQLNNVEGWLTINRYESALIKANCLVDALQILIEKQKSDGTN